MMKNPRFYSGRDGYLNSLQAEAIKLSVATRGEIKHFVPIAHEDGGKEVFVPASAVEAAAMRSSRRRAA